MSNSNAAGVDIEAVKLAMSMITPVVQSDLELSQLANSYMADSLNDADDVSKLLSAFVMISSLLVKVAKNAYEADSVEMPAEIIMGGIMLAMENQYG